VSPADEVEPGILRLGRKSEADSGRFTLDARFDVTGPLVLELDTHLTNAPRERELAAGSYAIVIRPDFRLWRDIAVAEIQVTAALASSAHQLFEITPGASTLVAYAFMVDGGKVVLDTP
jgi:hypothetical protein